MHRGCQSNKSVTDQLKARTPSDTSKHNALHYTESRARD